MKTSCRPKAKLIWRGRRGMAARWANLIEHERMALGLLCLASFIVTRYSHVRLQVEWASKGIQCSFCDYVIESISGDGPVSCSWFLGVLFTCLLLILLTRMERCPQAVLRNSSWRGLCASNFMDALGASLAASAAEFLFIVVSAAFSVFSDPDAGAKFCSFGSSESIYAAKTGAAMSGGIPPLPAFLSIAFMSMLLTSAFGAALFLLLRWLLGSQSAPLAILAVLGLSVVQSEYSFVYELFRSFGGTLWLHNPVYAVASLASVHWSRWAGGGPAGLGVMLALILALGCATLAIAPCTKRASRALG